MNKDTRRRVKVGATLDPVIVASVDEYLRHHPELDRSAIIDDALRLWWEREQDREMARQFEEELSPLEQEERAAWRRIRDAAAKRTFGRS